MTYYCEGCDRYHHGERGVCLKCGKGNRIDGFYVDDVKIDRILGSYPSEEEFVERCMLRGKGAFYKEWTNEEVMRVFYKRCLMLKDMRKKEPTIEEVKKYYDERRNTYHKKWLSKPNPRLIALEHFASSQIMRYKPATMLDIGCGIGILTKRLAGMVPHISAVDLSEKNIETAREHNNHEHITYTSGDFTRTLLGLTFNLVCAFDVVEHIRPSDRNAFLLNIKRHASEIVLVSIPKPEVTIENRIVRPTKLQIVDECVYDKDFSMFTIQKKISCGKFHYYILTP